MSKTISSGIELLCPAYWAGTLRFCSLCCVVSVPMSISTDISLIFCVEVVLANNRRRPFVCIFYLAILVTWVPYHLLIWYLPTWLIASILCNPRGDVILCLWDWIKESIISKKYPPVVVYVIEVMNDVKGYRCLLRKTINPSTMLRWGFSLIDPNVHLQRFLFPRIIHNDTPPKK